MRHKLVEGNDFIIRAGRPEDFRNYLTACQRSAQQAYSENAKDYFALFSQEHYFNPTLMPYWQAMASNTNTSRWWVAEIKEVKKSVVGGICMSNQGGRLEGRGFYIDPQWQNQGIGRQLWETRKKYINQPIYFEVYSHAKKTINFHLRNGALPTGNSRLIHWSSWPQGTNLIALEFVQK